MNMIQNWVLCALILSKAACSRFETDPVKENIQRGKQTYEEFKDNSKSGKSAGCWANAIGDLENSCENLTEETMSRLAYAFLTCHLQQHKRKIHLCDDQADIDSCTATLTDTMFGIYTSFVMHTHNMCFYLQSTLWQKKLDQTVDRLQDSSETVAGQLEIQAGKQENLLLGMDAMTDMNTDLLTKTEKLQTFLSHMMNIVEKIGYIQQVFFSQFSTYEMLFFYFGSVVVTFVTTGFCGVQEARPTMLGMTAISIAIEQAVTQHYGIFFDIDEVARFRIQKQLRRLLLLLCIAKWFRTMYSSRKSDNTSLRQQEILCQTRQTTNLLTDIQKQLAPLVQKSCLFSDDEELVTSERMTQTDGELSPLIIKPKKYSKKRSCEPKKAVGHASCAVQRASPGRSGTRRYNLRPITPTRPLAPPITWPGFSSDEGDEEYVPQLELTEI